MATDNRTLLELAVDAHDVIAKLATGLAHAGADPKTVAGLQHIAEGMGGLAKALGSGPVGASPGQPGAAEAAPAPGPAAPAPGPAGPPAEAAPAGPPQGARPGERPNGFHEAAASLQAALASKHAAAQRALAGNQ